MTSTSAAPALSLRQMFRMPDHPDLERKMRSAAITTRAAYRRLSLITHAFEIATRPGRTQVVFVDVRPGQREAVVESRIGRYHRGLRPRVLLTLNAEAPIGSICIEEIDGIPYVLLRARCDLDQSLELNQTLSLAAWTADELERDLFGHDVE